MNTQVGAPRRTANQRDDLVHAINQVHAFYGKELDQVQIKLWVRAIADLDFEKTREALADYVKYGKYAPKPIDIRNAVQELAFKERRENTPGLDHLGPEPAPEHIARVYRWAIKQRLGIDLYSDGELTDAEAEEYRLQLNQWSKERNEPDSVPEHLWLESVWGKPAHELQTDYRAQRQSA